MANRPFPNHAELRRLAGYSPCFIWPSRRAFVRYMATSRTAIEMPRELRREAAADPGLEWDPQTFGYRRKRKAAPQPRPAGGGGA